MRTLKLTLFFLILILLSAGCAHTKWWAYTQSEDEIYIKYFNVNGIPFREITKKINVYREKGQDNFVKISGKAVSKNSNPAKVRVTIDDKKTWQNADIFKNGEFSYRFSAETGKTYQIYIEIMDESGRVNNVESTGKKIIISAHNVRSVITAVLDAMIEAYQNKDAETFMSYISNDFAGDKDILDMAIRRDFSLLNNVELRYVLNTLASEANGKIYVVLTFNRFIISSRDGEPYSDRGMAAFVFQPGPEHPVVYSMKSPLLFGLSMASEVATGTVAPSGNGSVIVVDDSGNLSVESFSGFGRN